MNKRDIMYAYLKLESLTEMSKKFESLADTLIKVENYLSKEFKSDVANSLINNTLEELKWFVNHNHANATVEDKITGDTQTFELETIREEVILILIIDMINLRDCINNAQNSLDYVLKSIHTNLEKFSDEIIMEMEKNLKVIHIAE